jgi:Secretion system C-terminal sorting domain
VGLGKVAVRVHNVPGAWMNDRTRALFAAYPHGMIEDNTIMADPETATPGIKDAAVAEQMALWNETQWLMPNVPANDITHSAYIFGDYDPATIPGIVNGVKTEDAGSAAGITRFTDLIENFGQSTYVSAIDGLPIGSLIWNDSLFAGYNSASEYRAVVARYISLGGSMASAKEPAGVSSELDLLQNYPNPFNPTTTIRFNLVERSWVRLSIFNVLGQKVAEPANEEMSAGSHEKVWIARVASGLYFCRVEAVPVSDPIKRFVDQKKMLLLK